MAQFRTSADIQNEVLQKAGEPVNGNSPFETLAMTYINKAHHAIIAGGSIFNIDVDEPWTWARSKNPIILELKPAFTTGEIAVIQDQLTFSFSTAPTESLEGWYVQGNSDKTVYKIVKHDANTLDASFDSSWVGSTGSTQFRAFKLDYEIEPAYLIVDALTDKIDFREGGSAKTATLTHGAYTPANFVSHVVTKIAAAGTASWTGAYDSTLKTFSVTASVTASLLGLTGGQPFRSALSLLGLDTRDYTGATTFASTYTNSSVSRLIEPFKIFTSECGEPFITGTDPVHMQENYPIAFTTQRMPSRFCRINQSNAGAMWVRFNGYPRSRTRVQIDWIPVPRDLQDNAISIPQIPRSDADMLIHAGAAFIAFDKEDTKFEVFMKLVSSQLQAMQKRNRSELARMGPLFGQITPREEYAPRTLRYGYAAVGSASGQVEETPILDFVYDQVSDSLIYQGWAATGTSQLAAAWRVKKIVITGGDTTTVTWADGDTLFNNIWANRASLTYASL